MLETLQNGEIIKMTNFNSEPIQLKAKDVPNLRKWILEKRQNGLCAICGRVPERPCLDHAHQKRVKGSGLIRGVLCSTCNSFVAKGENNSVRFKIPLKDLPLILRKMADFLEQKQYPYIHPSEKEKVRNLSKNCFKQLQKEYSLKFPNRKPLEFPESGKLTKALESIFAEFQIEPKFTQSTKRKKKNV